MPDVAWLSKELIAPKTCNARKGHAAALYQLGHTQGNIKQVPEAKEFVW